ncbi:hypothetical protein ACYSNW_00940 [Enterococcus sp. LJL99]
MRVNDKMIVRQDLKVGKHYGKVEVYPGMRHLIGSEVTILSIVPYEKMDLLTQLQVDKAAKLYHIAEDPAGYLWSEQMFELEDEE